MEQKMLRRCLSMGEISFTLIHPLYCRIIHGYYVILYADITHNTKKQIKRRLVDK